MRHLLSLILTLPLLASPSLLRAATAPAASQASPSSSTASNAAVAPVAGKETPAKIEIDPFWPSDGVFPVAGKTSSWPGFRGANLRRRTLFAQHQAEDQNSIVFFGDSITEGWKTLAQDFAELGVKVANRGIGGDTTPNLVYRLQDDVLSLHPKGLVVLIGTNDLGERTTPAQIAENLKALHARVRASAPTIPIAWCLVMPRRDSDDYPARIRELNARVVELAKSDARSVVCDTFTPLAQEDGTSKPEDFKPDRLHLNEAGYAVWRSALLPLLTQWNLASK